jgi:hypothetical protein
MIIPQHIFTPPTSNTNLAISTQKSVIYSLKLTITCQSNGVLSLENEDERRERKSIILLEGSQATPARPSGMNNVKVKTLVEDEVRLNII